MTADERLEFAQHAIEMIAHGLASRVRFPRGDHPADRLVLGEGRLHAAGLGQQRAPDAFEVGADGIERLAHPRKTQSVGHLPMEQSIKFMKGLHIAVVERGALVGEVAGELFKRVTRRFARADRHNLGLEQPAHQHPLLDIRKPDLGDIGTALRLDHDESLEGEAVDGARHRQSGDGKASAPFGLVDLSLGRQRAGDDRLLQNGIDAVDF
jgi:hypothetical protein